MKTAQAKLFSLIPKDLMKATIMAVISAIAATVYKSIQVGEFPTDLESWKKIGIMAIGVGGSYLAKNFMTNSEDKFLKPEQK